MLFLFCCVWGRRGEAISVDYVMWYFAGIMYLNDGGGALILLCVLR